MLLQIVRAVIMILMKLLFTKQNRILLKFYGKVNVAVQDSY